MVLGLFGSLLEHGGIERHNRIVGVALSEIARERGEECELLSLNDGPGVVSYAVAGREYPATGFGRSKARLVAHTLGLVRGSSVAYLGHNNFAPVGVLLGAVNAELRFCVATHGFEVWQPLKAWERLALQVAAGVTAPSRSTFDCLVELQGLNPRRVTLLPHCLDPGFADSVRPGAGSSSVTEPGLVLTVGRLLEREPGKGVDVIIRALPLVIRAAPQTTFVVVGDGDLRPALESLAVSTGVSERVRFVGSVSDAELRDWYRKADVFVMPSRQEGFGIVFLEAMAFGVPVIGGAVGGTPDIISDGVTGYLVEYGDTGALADRLVRLLGDPEQRRRMSVAAREHVAKNYTFDLFRNRLRRLLDGSPASSRLEP
ncbi:MAG TPA: glycosyltransferase family 4 protein [Terriglobia bacterium]|nr:glycosyltransferase family 4 protein [Terriglobia bacterium]